MSEPIADLFGRKSWPGGRGQQFACRTEGGSPTAHRESCSAGVRDGSVNHDRFCVVTFGAGHFYVSQSDKGGTRIWRRHRRIWIVRAKRQPPHGRGCLRERHGPDAETQPAANTALLGRCHGHVSWTVADHRSRASGRPLSECRLVLRRVQGDARPPGIVSRTCLLVMSHIRRRMPIA